MARGRRWALVRYRTGQGVDIQAALVHRHKDGTVTLQSRFVITEERGTPYGAFLGYFVRVDSERVWRV